MQSKDPPWEKFVWANSFYDQNGVLQQIGEIQEQDQKLGTNDNMVFPN